MPNDVNLGYNSFSSQFESRPNNYDLHATGGVSTCDIKSKNQVHKKMISLSRVKSIIDGILLPGR